MIANLPMYHRPELNEAHDLYWALIRKHLTAAGIDSPETLSQDAGEMDVWVRPDLVFSQTCSMPFRKLIHDQVTLVGTPDFGVKGCHAGYYRSAFVVPKDDQRSDLVEFKNALFAYNMEISQSGYVAAKAEAAKHDFFFENRTCSGGHLNSALMIAEKKAEIAAIDAVSLKLMERYDDFYNGLKIIQWTAPTPSLPYISGPDTNGKDIFNAVSAAIDELPTQVRDQLMIKGIIQIPKETYLAID